MVELWIVLFILIFLVVVGIIILKTIIKVLLIIIIIFLFGFLVFGIMVVVDAKNVEKNLAEGNNIFILQHNDNFITVFNLFRNKLNVINEYQTYEKYFNNKDFSDLVERGYRVFIINYSVFEESKEENVVLYLDKKNISTSKIFALETLLEKDTIKEMTNRLIEEGHIDKKEDFMRLFNKNITDNEFKSYIFYSILKSSSKEKLFNFIIIEYNKENVIAYPKSNMFKFIALVGQRKEGGKNLLGKYVLDKLKQ